MSTSTELRSHARSLRARARALECIVNRLLEHAVEIEDHARQLDDVARPLEEDRLLRGSRIADMVAQIVDAGDQAHYQDILAALTARGYVIAGMNKVDNLLAVLGRDTRFESVRSRSGIFRHVDRRAVTA